MGIREAIATALRNRFGALFVPVGEHRGPVAVFPARHPDVGDAVVVVDAGHYVVVSIGQLFHADFENFDVHLPEEERAARLARDVIRFLEELRADRVLLWRSVDGRTQAWRERGDVGHAEPLVLDNRVYERYLWSGPMPAWQAVPAIIARGGIQNDRECEIVAILLQEGPPGALSEAERVLLGGFVAAYRRART